MTPCASCGGDARRFDAIGAKESHSEVIDVRARESGSSPRSPLGTELRAAGLTERGMETLRELTTRVGPAKLAPVMRAVDALASYVGLLHMAAAGNDAALDALAQQALGATGDREVGHAGRPSTVTRATALLGPRGGIEGPGGAPPFGDPLGGDGGFGNGSLGGLGGVLGAGVLGIPGSRGERPFPDGDAGPCGLTGPHPFTFFGAGLNAAGSIGGINPIERGTRMPLDGGPGGPEEGFGLGDAVVTWIDRAFSGWATRAVGLDGVLAAGGAWIDGGDPRGVEAALGGLLDPGDLLPKHPLPSMCLSEYQVCVSEFVFTASRLGQRLGVSPFPVIGSLSPADQCRGSAGPISLFPAAGQPFPASESDLQSGTFVALDRQPATVLSWTTQEIRLDVPAGIAPGCHSVGWVHVFDPSAVTQLRDIGEQCRAFFGSNSLVSAPYAVWADQQHFSIIEAPSIVTFHGPGGSLSPNAEACSPVTLAWETKVDSCSGSAVQIDVAMLRDGQPYRIALPAAGQLQVMDQTARTFTLSARARVGNQQCGLVTQQLTVTRFNELHVHPASGTQCVDFGVGIPIDVTISCPAPPGGLAVTVTSSDPSRVGNAAATIADGDTTTTVEPVTGAQCGPATLSVAVLGYPTKQVQVSTATDPQIASLTPATFQTCSPISITIDGSCLGESATGISASLDGNNQQVNGTVTMLAVETRLRVDFPAMPAGAYALALQYCGRTSLAPLPVPVTNRAPVIASFTSNVSQIFVCTAPSVKLSWTIHDAVRVVLKRGGTQLVDRPYANPCSSTNDSFTDNLQFFTGTTGVSYQLTAFNADGVTTVKTLTLAPASDIPVASAFIVANSSGMTVNVFLVNGDNSGGTFVAAMSNGQTLSIPIPQCAPRAIISIDPQEVAAHNAAFGTSFSATDVAVARTEDTWTRTTTPMVRGLSAATAAGVISV